MTFIKKAFTKRNAIKVLSFVLTSIISALIGWGVSYFLPVQNPIEKELTCTLNSVVKISNEDFGETNEDVSKYIYMSSISIKNTGNTAVINADFNQPMSIEFQDNTIMRAKVNKTSNKYVYDEVLKNAKFEDDFLSINDFLLNPSEEFTFLVFTKERPSKIIYHSRIANINELVLENEAKPIRIPINKEKSDAFLRFMYIMLAGVFIVIIAVVIFLIRSYKKDKQFYAEIEKQYLKFK